MGRIKFLLFFLFFILLSFFILPKKISSQCEGMTQDQCQQVVTDLAKKRDSLSAEIQYINSQIDLTTLKIQNTENKITETEKEIDLIDSRINGLDTSLNLLTRTLISRIVEDYKNHSISFFEVLFNSIDANDFFARIKYLQITQENNQKLLVQVQEAKLNYEDQKKLREEKKVELDSLKLALNNQKEDLNNQQSAKKSLLALTEEEYARAQAQLAAFRSFVASSGLGVISADPSWPSDYFSQRDSRWANHLIGYSSDNIFSVGCLLTSVAMVLKHNNVNTDPVTIASNTNYFDGTTAEMKYRWELNPWPNGLNASQISPSQVDDELNQGHYVIVGINYGACQTNSDHFVVLTKKDGDDYTMYDPLYGPNLKFYSKYSTICSAEVFK